MVPPFDIFRRQGVASVLWLGMVTDLEAAKVRVKELAETIPGEYFIFSLATGRRLNIKLDDAEPSTRKEQFASEPKEGPHAHNRPDLQSV
jgi:hypothetical protein